jgi:hypothetical protein
MHPAGDPRHGRRPGAGGYRVPVTRPPLPSAGHRRLQQRLRRGLRGRLAINCLAAAGALVAVIAVLAGCANAVGGTGRLVGVSIGPSTQTSGPTPAPTTTNPTPTTSAFSVVCPDIVDNAAGLAYTCVDDSMLVYPPSGMWSTDLEVLTEPNWSADQGSAQIKVSAGQSAQEAAEAVIKEQMSGGAYGDNATSKVQTQASVSLGASAYREDVLITLDPKYAQSHGYKVRSELLSVTVVEIATGRWSAMYMSVPDTKKQWWSEYDGIIAGMKLV